MFQLMCKPFLRLIALTRIQIFPPPDPPPPPSPNTPIPQSEKQTMGIYKNVV
jgi:hypothetical protein